eukprot:484979_1
MVDEDRIMSSFTDIKDDFLSRPFNQEVCEGIKVKLATHLRLDQMSTRSGGRAGQIYYITGHQAINYANEVFGFNGWRSELLECIVHHCEKSESGRWECLAIARMRITIRGGSFREDAGSAKAIAKTKLEVLENAQKSASTDAMKRCLRQFGPQLGNSTYDIAYITKIKQEERNRRQQEQVSATAITDPRSSEYPPPHQYKPNAASAALPQQNPPVQKRSAPVPSALQEKTCKVVPVAHHAAGSTAAIATNWGPDGPEPVDSELMLSQLDQYGQMGSDMLQAFETIAGSDVVVDEIRSAT